MVPGTVVCISDDVIPLAIISALKDHGITVIHESQTQKTEITPFRLPDVQAQQIRPRNGKQSRSPWFRQFEKTRKYKR